MKKSLFLISVATLLLLLTACNLLRTNDPEVDSSEQEMIKTITPANNNEITPTPTPIIIEETPQVVTVPTIRPTVTISQVGSDEVVSPTPGKMPLPTTDGVTSQPSPTVTPITISQPTATPVEPLQIIAHFGSNVEESSPGETVTLEWATNNAITTTLWKFAPTGQFSHFWNVDPAGTFDYVVGEGERNRTTFALSAINREGNSEMATVAVILPCTDKWFFPNPPEICPYAAPLLSDGAVQQFELGYMIWIEQEDRIYVLFADGSSPKWSVFEDKWQSEVPDRDPDLSPPAGYFQPARGFGLVWREEPSIRERLGWATGEEIAFSTALQRTSYAKYNETYIQAQDGTVWRLLAERSGWEQIPG